MLLHLHNGPFDGQTLNVADCEHRINQIVMFHDGPVPLLYECDHELELDQQIASHPAPSLGRYLFFNPDKDAVLELLEAETP